VTTPARDEWADLAAEWQRTPHDRARLVAELARKVRRHRRRMLAVLACEVLITLLALGASVQLVRAGDSRALVAATWCWLLVTVSWAFALWNRRGTWRPVAEHTRAYLELSFERCRRQLRAVRFVLAMVLVQFPLLALWVAARASAAPGGAHGRRALLANGFLLLLLAGYLGWAIWFRGRTRREIKWLEQACRRLENADVGP
jgi:Kef-type K+ transport system membrane component KefB